MSKAAQYADQMGWSYRHSGSEQIAVERCPYCGNDNYKFFLNASGGESDGLHDCKVCGESGNLWKLQKTTGVWMDDGSVASVKDAANARIAPAPLPNFEELHRNLMENDKYGDVLDYLTDTRGFSLDVIQKYKLGAATFKSKEYDGEHVLCYVIPYFNSKGEPVFYKARTLPVEDKKREFFSPAGREVPLFNEAVLTGLSGEHGAMSVCVLEGEADTLSFITNVPDTPVVGVPGAGTKKAPWIDKLSGFDAVYLIYDTDTAGQTNAKEMAIRIGMEKCRNVKLPEFTVNGKPGKDLNEYFVAGHTAEDFQKLVESARPFDVEGVHSVASILKEMEDELASGKSLEPKYRTPWEALNRRVGGFDDGDLVGFLADAKVGKTTAALNVLHYLSAEHGHVTFMYCNEMLPKRMGRKWVSHVTQTIDDHNIPGNNERVAAAIRQSYSIADSMKGDMLFGYTTEEKSSHVFDTIRQAVRRYGVKVVCFDNLQLLSRSLDHTAQELSRLTKDFKKLAMELQILIILIIQPRKIQEGHIVSANDSAGSGAITKDVDYMITFHRNRVAQVRASEFTGFLETEENFEPQMYCRADLTRYSSGGVCTLWMDGARSTVRDVGTSDDMPVATKSGLIAVEQVAA